jgi:hypothetical protein
MIDNHIRQIRKVRGFYLEVASMIKKDIQHRTTLDKIAERYDRNTAFSYMQWQDAKQWFSSEAGGVYCLKPHLVDTPLIEIYRAIENYYKRRK